MSTSTIGPLSLQSRPTSFDLLAGRLAELIGTDDGDRKPRRPPYRAYGAAAKLFESQEPEVILSGPAGTGKSRAILERWHQLAKAYPGARGLMIRKTGTALAASGVVTYQRDVLGYSGEVVFKGATPTRAPAFHYPNGSQLVIGGLDKPEKVLSTDYDWIFFQEATEGQLDDWETLTTRLRTGVLPFQQIVGDCNPDAPTHWIKQRSDNPTERVDGTNGPPSLRLFESRHEDNPVYWDRERGEWTPEGRRYVLGVLERLTGVTKKRLRYGIWAAAEGMVYDGWDPATHVIDRFDIPRDWPRYWTVDFGYVHSFVWQDWAEDPDGRLILDKEIHKTRRLVSDHAKEIAELTAGEPRPRAVICDHDAEGRATLERELSIKTTPAHKAVSEGIQAVAERLKDAGDGRPRLLFFRDACSDPDPELLAAYRPTTTVQEVERYVWDTSGGRRKGEDPVKEHDDGMDGMRYMVAHRDLTRAKGDRPRTPASRPMQFARGVGRRQFGG